MGSDLTRTKPAIDQRNDLKRLFALNGRTRASGYGILAHSMGSLLLVEAIRQAKTEGRFNRSGTLRSVLMAAPDNDVDLFAGTLLLLDANEHQFYVLISDDNKTLCYSHLIAGGEDRVGVPIPSRFPGRESSPLI